MRKIDLHVHTTASDGTFTPAEAVELAVSAGLSAIAVTDHDTVSGHQEAMKAGRMLGAEIVPGIEISTKYMGSVHILGYYIDDESPKLLNVLNWIVDDRNDRNRKMAAAMAADGIKVDYDEMLQRFGDVLGRPHFARILVEQGYAVDIADAFARYVNKGQKYYLPRWFLSIERSVQLIRDAGGVPVLAHPFQYKMDDETLRGLIELCMENGLQGMECRYSGYTEEQSLYLLSLADEYGLVPTGGSDFHGSNKPHISLGTGTGTLDVPYSYLEGLRAAKDK